MNGRKAHIDDHKSIVGFVPQVREHILNCASHN